VAFVPNSLENRSNWKRTVVFSLPVHLDPGSGSVPFFLMRERERERERKERESEGG
jgi:hypothetical protein